MRKEMEILVVIVELCLVVSGENLRRSEEGSEDQPLDTLRERDFRDHYHYKYKTYTPSNIPREHPAAPKLDLQELVDKSPLAATLLLGSILHLPSGYSTPNHPELLPVNPFLALLLSQYGRYLPQRGGGRGLYGYAAANNYHNNKPFGAYKIYEDGEKR